MTQTERESAEALFLIAAESERVEAYGEALTVLRGVMEENPEYAALLASPAIPMAERLSLIDEAFTTLPEDVVSFVKLLCQNGRIPLLIPAVSEYEKMVSEVKGRTEAKVYYAHPLSEEQKAALCEKLSELTGKEVTASYFSAPELIGGVKVEIDGKTFDGSIKKSLQDVKDVMNG